MQDGADHEPSGSRAMTIPEPAFPENMKPALRTENTARPSAEYRLSLVYGGRISDVPLALCRTALGMAFKADSLWSGSATSIQSN